jgi:hypothetical protein
MNKEQEGIIELVGQEYTKWFYDNAVPSVSGKPILNGEWILTRGEFINKCKNDSEFSEKWGLKIEERELSWKERSKLLSTEQSYEFGFLSPFTDVIINYYLNQKNIPTKLITITYNEKTIESYE